MNTIENVVTKICDLRDNWRKYRDCWRKGSYCAIITLTEEIDIIAEYEVDSNWDINVYLHLYNKTTDKCNTDDIICRPSESEYGRVSNTTIEARTKELFDLVLTNNVHWNTKTVTECRTEWEEEWRKLRETL